MLCSGCVGQLRVLYSSIENICHPVWAGKAEALSKAPSELYPPL